MFSSEVFSVLTLGLRLRENIENIFFLNQLLQIGWGTMKVWTHI